MKSLRKGHDMLKALRPSSWGLKALDVIFFLIILALIVKVVAPTSGLGAAMHTVFSWLAIGITYLADLTARFLTWL